MPCSRKVTTNLQRVRETPRLHRVLRTNEAGGEIIRKTRVIGERLSRGPGRRRRGPALRTPSSMLANILERVKALAQFEFVDLGQTLPTTNPVPEHASPTSTFVPIR